MIACRQNRIAGGLCTALLAGFFLAPPASHAQEQHPLDSQKLPQTVLDSLKARFPQAEIRHWSKETEHDVVVYDVEFQQAGRKFEADVQADGTIQNWEREIAAADLPAAVKQAVDQQHPKSTLKEVMEITEVKDGKDVREGYEVVVETADKRTVELTVAPDGKILEEESGDQD